VRDAVVRGDATALADCLSGDEDARRAAPTPEHFLPLLYVMGVRRDGETIRIAAEGLQMGAVSMLSAVIGGPEAAGKA
jgi:4,5-DOPA dioxygenase extradiol